LLLGADLLGLGTSAGAATINRTFCVSSLNKSLSGQSVRFWGFGDCGGMMGGGTSPGPVIELGAGSDGKRPLRAGFFYHEAISQERDE
jgi:hypothetical protein